MVTRVACLSIFYSTPTWCRQPTCRCTVKASPTSCDCRKLFRPFCHFPGPEIRSGFVPINQPTGGQPTTTSFWQLEKVPSSSVPSIVATIVSPRFSPLPQDETSLSCRGKVVYCGSCHSPQEIPSHGSRCCWPSRN